MNMTDVVGVGTDWIEIKRQKEEYAAQAVAQAVARTKHEKAIATARKLLAKGISPDETAEFVDLPVDDVKALIGD